MSVDEERVWWDALEGDEIVANTAGDPPYDVNAVADKIIAELDMTRLLNTTRLLDLGCGVGRLTNAIARKLHPPGVVFGVDISRQLLNHAVSAAPSNALYWRGDGRHLPTMTSNRFTGAYSVTMFQHVPYDAMLGYIAEVHQHLVDEGTFLFTVSVGDSPNGFLNHQLSPATLGDLQDWMTMYLFRTVTVEDVDDNGWTWIRADK